MAYPSLEQFQEALQHPSTALTDPELKTATVAATGLGLPLVLCGGSALTYQLRAGSHTYALRCFHREMSELQERYSAITTHLRRLQSPCFVAFEFQPDGVRIGGHTYPTVKMAWADGETLGAFMERRHEDRLALRNLLQSLRNLARFLEEAGIAHGDLQPGNIMVSAHGRVLQLIDYDGMYLEILRELGSPELGHRNFQHPLRPRSRPYDAALDRFSLLAMTLALTALSHDPSLWQSSGSDMDALLFRSGDYAEPLQSSLFQVLASLPAISREARQFAAVCQAPVAAVPSLEDFLAGRGIAHPLPQFPTVRRASLRPAYTPSYPVLDAGNYRQCLAAVGERVEVVGRIRRVHRSHTRWGEEYLFLNFGHWEGNIVKVNLWNEGLRVLRNRPDASWEGLWISVVGLMEPPWISPQHGYQHLAITVTQSGQLHPLTDSEARARLARASTAAAAVRPAPADARITSSAAIRSTTGVSQSQPWYRTAPAAPASPPQPPPAPRRNLLARLLHWWS